ncbi:hypothetical protein P175DRAFT_0513064 [Aspergillus ochraceoroseus IBT 24754]|uniref:Probable beta-glucosidase btgE n=2 Tax=Aspergillus ochraceoroseus TaxID=138278 RepID=A0A2T5M5Z8_9EURO|nr:uncharacterized protein P175DRAFT_0513064 [Aspergillus ochraceoroseus IBT 24754]KKK23716.1 hypothetical protein AOCH_006793 [Aspergillus ochraceoroseus]PTU23958.1 hypothetical protein P175DRAFT_0513064 [Aspergillus ochraceoroseus IBT 24754]
MKGAILATAAAVVGTAMADISHLRRHGHEAFHQRALAQSSPAPQENCGCTTEVITFWGEPTLVPVSVAPTSVTSETSVTSATTVTSETTTTVHSTSYTTVTIVATSSETPSSTVVLPTPGVTSFSTTGTYTIPATTLTVTDTTTVCGATTTELPSGTHTYGGVTTIVETQTTIVCPYATVKPSGTTVTSVIETTTYICPSAGTYTIAPTTTYVPTSTVMVYPTPATITPGTYTQPESTITVTRTDYTYVCPYATNEPTSASAIPTSAAVTTPAAVTTSAVPTTTPVESTTVESTTVATSTAVATTTTTTTTAATTTTTASSSSSSSSSTGSTIPTNGPQMGMTFTPYLDSGDWMPKDDIATRIANIKSKGFTHVRVYATDCHTLDYVTDAVKANGLKIILGVFISGPGIDSGAENDVAKIVSWAQWDLVSHIVVGNEAINSGKCSASVLAGFISESKAKFQAAGYTGLVTTAEPIDVWLIDENASSLCSVVDIVGANLHPFFNNAFTAAQAGELVSNQITDLKKVCSDKDVVNLETGWPNAGDANGLAVPGQTEQTTAIKSLVDTVGSLSVFFSYSDDPWKKKISPNDKWNVETHWGCIDQF